MTYDGPQFDRLQELCGLLRDGEATADTVVQIEALLTQSDELRRYYVELMCLQALCERHECGLLPGDKARESNSDQLQIPNPPVPVAAPLGREYSLLDSLSYFATDHPYIFSYIAATVLFVVAAVGGHFYKIEHYTQYARTFGTPNVLSPLPSSHPPLPSPVARITGMVDVEWGSGVRGQGAGVRGQGSGTKNPEIPKSRNPESRVPNPEFQIPTPHTLVLGDRLDLSSGLVQLTYNSGAQVILQGPCTYEVNSPAGGFLAVGKLTARVEGPGVRGQGPGTVDNGQWTEDSAKPQASDIHHSSFSTPHSPYPSPLAPRPLPLFTVTTPTATITDLGTEFGIEVDEQGGTNAHVFRGSISVQASVGSLASGGSQILKDNESVRIETAENNKPIIHLMGVTPEVFVRHLPRRESIRVFNTGVGLEEGQPDPHWQITAISNDPTFQPCPAVVVPAVDIYWLPNETAQSQWISLGARGQEGGVSYTFQTTFDLTGLRPETAVLYGRFLADNGVQTIRINGQDVPVPPHPMRGSFDLFRVFVIRDGFREGVNTLTVVVANSAPEAAMSDPDDNPMGLRVELEGSAMQSWKTPKTEASETLQKSPSKGG